ncbi:single-stranded DNA-binding protein [Cellulosimicrobium composti]|uniref:single-stranded DNA-binding protein n=1 Tax=Cellulosimicrobium composti TaxID=2672572 RepID=UPI0037A5F001
MPGDVTVTLSGFVATTPTLFRSESGNDFTSFRIAQTRRYLDRERGEWVDGRTLWFTVKVWKATARNVAVSLHKGDPVVVTGRLSLDEWEGPLGPRTSLVVEATALGPDLTLGEARFARTVHRRDVERRAEDGTGAPDGDAGREHDEAGAPNADDDARDGSARDLPGGSETDDGLAPRDPWTSVAQADADLGPDTGPDAGPDVAVAAATAG